MSDQAEERETFKPSEKGQPEVVRIFDLARVEFEDGAIGEVTNWVDSLGEVHDALVMDAVAVVAKHPGDVEHPWYAIRVDQEDRS